MTINNEPHGEIGDGSALDNFKLPEISELAIQDPVSLAKVDLSGANQLPQPEVPGVIHSMFLSTLHSKESH